MLNNINYKLIQKAKLINSVYERSATSALTVPILPHLFFIGSRIQTGSPGFSNFSFFVPCLSKLFFVLPSVCSSTEIYTYLVIFCGCPRGVMVKAMNCGIVVREFVLQSRYYVHFRANTLGKGMNPLILPPAMGK